MLVSRARQNNASKTIKRAAQQRRYRSIELKHSRENLTICFDPRPFAITLIDSGDLQFYERGCPGRKQIGNHSHPEKTVLSETHLLC
jgi:hypothetical protein